MTLVLSNVSFDPCVNLNKVSWWQVSMAYKSVFHRLYHGVTICTSHISSSKFPHSPF